MPGIKDKIVAITGASSGIGEATALLLAGRGAKVVLGARRVDQLEALAGRIAGAGGEAAYRRIDVTQRDDLTALVGLACNRFGRLDVLVNNAGIAPASRFDALQVDDWDAMIDVNLRGVLYGIAAALPVFRAQGSGHIINVISTAGLKIVPSQGVYAATKNAVRTLSEALRQEAGKNLRVTGVSPGSVQTNLPESMSDPEVRSAIIERMRSIAIPPDAIARAIVRRNCCPAHRPRLIPSAYRDGKVASAKHHGCIAEEIEHGSLLQDHHLPGGRTDARREQ